MPHSYVSNRIHVVFSTRERRNQIPSDCKLSAYICGIGKDHGFPVFVAGGTANHVHLLMTLPATVPLAKAVQTIKAVSSKWMHESGTTDFAWQEGYGAFSVSASNIDAVAEYIRRQEEHHRQRSFEDEFRTLLRKSGVEFDEKYVFG